MIVTAELKPQNIKVKLAEKHITKPFLMPRQTCFVLPSAVVTDRPQHLVHIPAECQEKARVHLCDAKTLEHRAKEKENLSHSMQIFPECCNLQGLQDIPGTYTRRKKQTEELASATRKYTAASPDLFQPNRPVKSLA